MEDSVAYCNWNDPARFPALSKIDLDVQGRRVSVILRAARGAPAAAKDSPSTRPTAANAAYDPRGAIRDLDPAAPGGVRVGLPLGPIAQQLERASFTTTGYGTDRGSCQWRFTRFNEVDVRIVIRPELTVSGGGRRACGDGAIIRNVSYHKVNYRPDFVSREPDSGQLAEAWRKRLRAPDDPRACIVRNQSTGPSAQCDWRNPPGTGFASISIRHSRYRDAKATADITLIAQR